MVGTQSAYLGNSQTRPSWTPSAGHVEIKLLSELKERNKNAAEWIRSHVQGKREYLINRTPHRIDPIISLIIIEHYSPAL